MLSGEAANVGQPPDGDIAAAVRAAEREGVVSLLHQRFVELELLAHPVSVWRTAFALSARNEAIHGLAHSNECARVLSGLSEAGIQALVLKGTALAAWLYPEPYLRKCGDLDLLFSSRREVDQAIEVLSRLGYYAPVLAVAGDLVSFELMCVSGSRGFVGFEIDLHWKLCNTPLYADIFDWNELAGAAIELPTLGKGALGLEPVHALIHACLHRAHNLQFGDGDRLRWLYDIKLLCGRLDNQQWSSLAALARQRNVAGPCADGMLAARRDLGASIPPAVLESLAIASRVEPVDIARMRSWLYAQWATARSFKNWRLRLRWLGQRLFPDSQHLRQVHRGNGKGLFAIHALRARRMIFRLRPPVD